MAETEDEDGSHFDKFLGGFGIHTDIAGRKRKERLASMKADDARRRRATRTHQFNVRVDDETVAFSKALLEQFSTRDKQKWSQADLIIFAIAELAKAQKGKGET